MEAKLAAAKEFLGEAWVLHPRYDPLKHPQHTTKRPAVLAPIENAARAAGRL